MTKRKYRLNYGHEEVDVDAPLGREPKFLTPSSPAVANDTSHIIKCALDNPIDSPPLTDVVSGAKRVAIVASDSTRATSSHLFLPHIIEELNAAGIPDRNITIVIALGIHRPQTKEEHRGLLGDQLYRRFAPIDHDSRNRDNLVSYGKTSRGTEVAVNRTVAEADRIVLTGAVSPHYFAGFGGGRKSIMPGVCSLEASLQSHLLVFNPPPGRGRNPNARVARLAGNPVHEDMLEAAGMVGPHFMLNSIVTPEKELAAVFAGNFIKAHEAACFHYIKNFSIVVPEQADLTVVSCGGYPKDINFIQAHKAIHSAHSVTKPGGWMIVLAECADGFGHPGFIDWFRFDDAIEFEQELRANYHIYGQTAYAAFEKAMSVNIALISRLDPLDVQRMKMRPAASFEEAYRAATANLPNDFTTYIIPAASSTLFLPENERSRSLASIGRSVGE
ncbi:nickel-dependent lactate racemase [Candidatus Poribacteria bacterium]|nr:nickel-dependent lactate racemase [Candidatus Poribacteria bacterium]